MENYKPNSDNRKTEKTERKFDPVVSKKATLRKKSGAEKMADSFFASNIDNVKKVVVTEVVVPAIKKIVSEIISVGTDMLLYGESSHTRKQASKVSYRNYFEPSSETIRANSADSRRSGLGYDDILFDTRGDAEAVLDTMNDIIDRYGTVSVADLYDLARVPNDNFTLNRYGWTNLSGAYSHRTREGYILKLPRTKPL